MSPLYRIDPKENVTFIWEFQSVLVRPVNLTLAAVGPQSATYTITVLEGGATSALWQLSNVPAATPLMNGYYQVQLYDQRGISAVASPGWLSPQTSLTIAFYSLEGYSNISATGKENYERKKKKKKIDNGRLTLCCRNAMSLLLLRCRQDAETNGSRFRHRMYYFCTIHFWHPPQRRLVLIKTGSVFFSLVDKLDFFVSLHKMFLELLIVQGSRWGGGVGNETLRVGWWMMVPLSLSALTHHHGTCHERVKIESDTFQIRYRLGINRI